MAAPGAVFLSSPSNTVGEWLSLVEHLVRDQGVGGSNPLSPTNFLSTGEVLLPASTWQRHHTDGCESLSFWTSRENEVVSVSAGCWLAKRESQSTGSTLSLVPGANLPIYIRT